MDNFVMAVVEGDPALRCVRVDNPVEGFPVRVSGEDRILRKLNDQWFLSKSVDFIELAPLKTEVSNLPFTDPFFDLDVFGGYSAGNLITLIVVFSAIVGIGVWSWVRH